MAKHAHRLILIEKKTWRCTLPGCSYFIHIGLEYILPGKRMECFGCGDDFTVSQNDVDAAKDGDDMLKCLSCRLSQNSGISKSDSDEMTEMVDLKTNIFKKYGTNRVSDVEPAKIRSMVNMGLTTQRAVDRALEFESNISKFKSNIEETKTTEFKHRSDCASVCFPGMVCDCKDEVDYT